LQGGGPFSLAETYFNSIENGNPLFAFPNAFPASLASATVSSQSISAYPTRTNNGTIHQYSVSVEQQVADIGFRISYIGSRSRGLNYNLNINKPEASLIPFEIARRPYSQFVNVTMAQEDGRSNYDSFQFRANRKVGTITFDAHYTLQSSISDFLNLENPYNHRFFNREALQCAAQGRHQRGDRPAFRHGPTISVGRTGGGEQRGRRMEAHPHHDLPVRSVFQPHLLRFRSIQYQ